jgi:hypothetical protein
LDKIYPNFSGGLNTVDVYDGDVYAAGTHSTGTPVRTESVLYKNGIKQEWLPTGFVIRSRVVDKKD